MQDQKVIEEEKKPSSTTTTKKISKVRICLTQANQNETHQNMAGDLPMGLGAFVAPDEKSIEKMAKRPQTSLKEVLSKKYFDHPIVPRFLKAEGNYSKFRYDITCKPGGVSLEKLKEIIRKGVKVAKGQDSIKILKVEYCQ